MYTTLANVQAMIGPSATTPEAVAQINILLSATTGIIDGILGGDIITLKQRQQRFDKCDLNHSCFDLLFDGLNVVSIDQIDGQPYTGVVNTDYVVEQPNKRKVCFYNFPTSLINTKFCSFEVTYTSGYDPIPDDLAYAQTLMIMGEFGKDNGQEVKSYKLRERTVTFKDDTSFVTFQSILGRYMTLYL